MQSEETNDADIDDETGVDEATQLPSTDPISWKAIEYSQHDKGPLWYVGFVVVVLGLVTIAVFAQAWTFIALILVMSIALMVYSHRPPRELQYVWSGKGLYINEQLHPMGEFKAFGVIQDDQHNQLMFIPVKRFRPGLAVYFPSEVGEELVDAVGSYIPMQELHLDAFDKIVQKLRI